jgi:hypothetical protein
VGRGQPRRWASGGNVCAARGSARPGRTPAPATRRPELALCPAAAAAAAACQRAENEKIQAEFANVSVPEPKTPYHGPSPPADDLEDEMRPLALGDDGAKPPAMTAFDYFMANGAASGGASSGGGEPASPAGREASDAAMAAAAAPAPAPAAPDAPAEAAPAEAAPAAAAPAAAPVPAPAGRGRGAAAVRAGASRTRGLGAEEGVAVGGGQASALRCVRAARAGPMRPRPARPDPLCRCHLPHRARHTVGKRQALRAVAVRGAARSWRCRRPGLGLAQARPPAPRPPTGPLPAPLSDPHTSNCTPP